MLAGTAESAAASRRLVAEALIVAGRPAAGDAALVVSELAANAVQHTRSGKGGEVRVTVAAVLGEWVAILVGDDGPDEGAVPAIPVQRASADAESGRGLLLVAALSAAYGYAPCSLSWR